jgi:hypothetical protein
MVKHVNSGFGHVHATPSNSAFMQLRCLLSPCREQCQKYEGFRYTVQHFISHRQQQQLLLLLK